jgi:hypothetical protein
MLGDPELIQRITLTRTRVTYPDVEFSGPPLRYIPSAK